MRLALIWLIFTYAALKLGSMARPGHLGFRGGEIHLLDRLRAREPGLFMSSILLSVPLALLAERYVHRTLTSQYEHSIACYGRIKALRVLPASKDEAGDFAVYERAEGHKQTAFLMARDLKIGPGDVSIALNRQDMFYTARYAMLQNQGRRREVQEEIGMAQRCLLPPGPG